MSGPSGTEDSGRSEVGTLADHLGHGLMSLVPLMLFALFFVAEWRRTAGGPLAWSLRGAVVASAGAGVVHAVVVPHHASEHSLLGWFFSGLALAQLGWVLAVLVSPSRRVVVAGVLGNVAVVLLWAWTRAVSVPFALGPRQRFAPLDLAATALEVGVVVGCLAWVYSATGGSSLSVALSKWDRSTTMNSPPPTKTRVPSPRLPSHETQSLRPSRRSTFATRS
jgi:hypothetical protein